MKHMKTTFFLKAIVVLSCITLIFSCKKENKTTPSSTQNTNSNTTPPTLTVSSIPEANGNQKVFNVIERTINTVTSSSTSTVTVLKTFNATLTVTGDTILPNSVHGKKYLLVTNHVNFPPVAAISYTNAADSTWNFKPSNYSNLIQNLTLKLPLTKGQSWILAFPPSNFHFNTADLNYFTVNNLSTYCFFVGGGTDFVNFQTTTYDYYINSKGIIKMVNDFITVSNFDYSQHILEYELNMFSCNF